MNNFARGCNFLTFAIMMSGKMVKRLIRCDKDVAKMFCFSLCDYNKGLFDITKIGSDEKMQMVKEYASKPVTSFIFVKMIFYTLYTIAMYPKTHKQYLEFREQKLKDSAFWKHFLGMA